MNTSTHRTDKPAPRPAASTEPAQPYHYFISALVIGPRGISTMQVEVDRWRPIEAFEDVMEVQAGIRLRYGVRNAEVMGVSLLRNDLTARQRGQA
ncbi:hypothetical protein [Actinoplanes regularis]|uniref:hypothetical protein n=1 Tax=Actinoplanes regularis TaxID=52697 RepID=UPI0024A21805|nr:hypothetical protein [Actinoplanes regularis]GLW31887.1 hypothetical protein Areg01_48260 [Actinoplanes regularis]